MKFFAVVIGIFVAIATVESLPVTGGPSSVFKDVEFDDISDKSSGNFHILEKGY